MKEISNEKDSGMRQNYSISIAQNLSQIGQNLMTMSDMMDNTKYFYQPKDDALEIIEYLKNNFVEMNMKISNFMNEFNVSQDF